MGKKGIARSHDKYIEEINNIDSNILVLGRYINQSEPILHYCKIHDFEFKRTPRSILNKAINTKHKKICPLCTGNKKTTEMYKKELLDLGIKIKCIGEYKSNKDKIEHYCEEHDYKWFVGPRTLKKAKGCPICNRGKSKQEKEIYGLLQTLGIEFKSEYKFDELLGINGQKLRYDFAVFKNNKIKLLIEYDGQMHYKKTNLGNDLLKQLLHDNLKSEYAKSKKIDLLRIPYWESKNIKAIIETKLRELRLI